MKVIQITKESAMARFTMKIVTFITEILQYNNNYNSYMKVIQEHRNQHGQVYYEDVTLITEVLQYNNNYNSYMKAIQEHRNQLWPGLLRKCYFHYEGSCQE